MIDILTVKEIKPLFKTTEEGTQVGLTELILFEENDFTVVRQKGLQTIGEKVMFIYPDWCLSDKPIFQDYIAPGGDPKKSKLGSNNRIRAIKFNLHLEGETGPVFSNGIIFSKTELESYGYIFNSLDFSEFDITKWEEPAGTSDFPSNLYKTDEHNILGSPFIPGVYHVHVKADGSSITLGKVGDTFVCSRRRKVGNTHKVFNGFRKPTYWESIKEFFGFSVDLKTYIDKPSDSPFIKVSQQYIDALFKSGFDNITLRGELIGKTGSKGSGNKYNPDSKKEADILFFGVDYYNGGSCVKGSNSDLEYVLQTLTKESGVEFKKVQHVITQYFGSKQECLNFATNWFKDNFVEGLIFRTEDSNISFKVMNLEYDAKK